MVSSQDVTTSARACASSKIFNRTGRGGEADMQHRLTMPQVPVFRSERIRITPIGCRTASGGAAVGTRTCRP